VEPDPGPATVAGLWLPLWQHLDDAGGTAGLLWDQWLPTTLLLLWDPAKEDTGVIEKTRVRQQRHRSARVLPARAGMIPGTTPAARKRPRAPRASGDDPVAGRPGPSCGWCSPRERGCSRVDCRRRVDVDRASRHGAPPSHRRRDVALSQATCPDSTQPVFPQRWGARMASMMSGLRRFPRHTRSRCRPGPLLLERVLKLGAQTGRRGVVRP
jgi:hypothetical protein